jgi:hypothetical protein
MKTIKVAASKAFIERMKQHIEEKKERFKKLFEQIEKMKKS